MRRNLLLICSLAVGMGACGTDSDKSVSVTKDIANPGPNSEANQVIWIEDGLFVLGDCEPETLPSRANCERRSALPFQDLYNKVDADLTRELNASQDAYNEEERKLKEVHPDLVPLRQALEGLKRERSNEKAKVPKIQASIDTKHDEIRAYEREIAQYEAQIASVKEEIAANPNDETLKNLLARLEQEKRLYDFRLGKAEEALAELETQLAATRTKIAQLDQTIEVKEREYKDKWDATVVSSPQLNSLAGQIATQRIRKARLGKVVGFMRDASLTYRHDLLDSHDRYVVDLLMKEVRKGSGMIRFQGTYKPTLIFHQGEWRAICDDNFDEKDAQVICRSQGKEYVSHRTDISTDGNYWLSNLGCSGTECSLLTCPHQGWGSHRCSWDEGVSVKCQ